MFSTAEAKTHNEHQITVLEHSIVLQSDSYDALHQQGNLILCQRAMHDAISRITEYYFCKLSILHVPFLLTQH